MATQSVQKDYQGPDWPLGAIAVATPGTPVNIMSLVDSGNVAAPQTATSYSATSAVPEYTVRAQKIIFQAVKAGASHGLANNTGNIYICRKGVQGAGNRDDYGSIIATIAPGATFVLEAAALDRNVFNPYRYSIDADNAADGALVTLIIQ